MRISSDSWWLMAAGVAAVAAAPFLVRGDTAVNQRRDQSRQALTMMSPAERQRLDANYELYKKLTPDERSKMHALHQAVEADKTQSGSAAKALTVYTEWVPSVQPFALDELRHEGNPDSRVALIKDIEAQKDIRRAQGNAGPMRNWARFSFLTPDEFWRIMDVIESTANTLLNDEDREAIDKYAARDPMRAYTLIERLRAKNEYTFDKLVSQSPYSEMISTLRSEIRGLFDERFQDRRNSESGNSRPSNPVDLKNHFKRQVAMKLVGMLYEESSKKPASDAELTARLNALTQEEQEWYYSLAADELKGILRWEFFRQTRFQRVETVSAFFEVPIFFGPGRGGRGNNNEGSPGGNERREGDREGGEPREGERRPGDRGRNGRND